MTTKICTKCRTAKDANEFYNHKREPDGKDCWCKECSKKNCQDRYSANRNQIISRVAQYQKDNPEKVRAIQQRWRDSHREQERARLRSHYSDLDEEQRDILRKYARDYVRAKKVADPSFKIAHATRKRIAHALHRVCSTGVEPHVRTPSKTLLGCTFQQYKGYLEGLMEPGMTWKNHGNRKGQWSIDHIIPCASFDLTDPGQQKKCFHFTNTKPCWAVLNASKGCKV